MRKRVVLAVLETLFRLGLGALFVYSAWTKIADPDEFAYSVSRYQFLPEVTIGLFSLTMPMLELLAGLTLLFTRWLRESALLISVMLVMFIVALAQALARGLEISCGCFGVPSVGGRQEILMALVRDVVLIVPAFWLMFRPNTWIEPLRRLPRKWRTLFLWVLGGGLAALFFVSGDFNGTTAGDGDVGTEARPRGEGQGLVVSSGPIRPGEWNANFEGVLAKAEREQRPMVLLHVGTGCRYCARLEACIAGETFRLWRKDRAPLMAFVRARSAMTPPEVEKKSREFIRTVNKDVDAYPYVCVYWPQAGVTNSVAFSGRRGQMGGREHKLLVMEFMSALDQALGSWQKERRQSLEALVKAAAGRVSVRAEGAGTIEMMPENGLLLEGKTVELSAYPDAGNVFLDWRRPDGTLASRSAQLNVRGGMPVGCYTARFKKRSQCLPPVLVSPAETTLCVRVLDPFKYVIKVTEASRPVRFKAKTRMPLMLKLDPIRGVVSGNPHFLGTNKVTLAAVGYDPKHTERTIQLTIVTAPREGADGEEADESSSDKDSAGAGERQETKK